MEIVCEQFNLDKTDIDYQLLDDTLHKLKFFQKYSLGTRLTLLKVSKLVHFNSGDIVFRQGDVGEFLYIIVQGSVNVRVSKKQDNYVEDKVVAVLYDGYVFGELAMMKTNQKRQEPQQQSIFQNLTQISMQQIRQYLMKKQILEEFEEDFKRKGFRKE